MEVILEQLPNKITAAPGVTVVIEGTLEMEVDVAVYQEVAVVTSNGFVVLTPEKATITPVAAVLDAVTENV